MRLRTCHRIIALNLLFLGSGAEAAIQLSLNDSKVIEAPISRDGLTRITVKNDRILNVFGVANEYVLEADEDQGQVFIRPRNVGFSGSISLTLTTESGYTQDLCLTPQDQAPEALILESTDSESQTSKKNHSQTSITHDEIDTLLQACQEERIPLGYKRIPLKLQTFKESPLLIREIKGEKLRGLTYEVQNRNQKPLILSESEFAIRLRQGFSGLEVVAIFMPKKTLTSGERPLVYVVARTN